MQRIMIAMPSPEEKNVQAPRVLNKERNNRGTVATSQEHESFNYNTAVIHLRFRGTVIFCQFSNDVNLNIIIALKNWQPITFFSDSKLVLSL